MLENLLKALSEQFQEAITKALTRIDQDHIVWQKLFLSNSQNKDHYLTHISFAH